MRRFRTKKQEVERAEKFIEEMYSKYKNNDQLNNDEDGKLENGEDR